MAEPFHDYLLQRWNEGIQNIVQLQREIRGQGFTGSYATLWNYLQPWKQSLPPKRAIKHPDPAPSPRQAAWTLLTHPDQRTELQKHQEAPSTPKREAPLCWGGGLRVGVAVWCEACAELSKTHELAKTFGTMVRARQADHLDEWINAAVTSGIPIWSRFAASLQSDYQAVLNALKLPWSNGMVEGSIQRLKLIKRQAYGRAKLDLLKARVMKLA